MNIKVVTYISPNLLLRHCELSITNKNPMTQYTLKLQSNQIYNPHDFIFSSSNNELKTIIDNFGVKHGEAPYPNVIVIEGPHKSGKTHFLHLFSAISKAKWLEPDTDILSVKEKYIVVDDIHLRNEEDLLHLFNYIHENDKIGLFTCPNYHEFKLPDLSSRLHAAAKANIHEPDDFMLKSLLSKNLIERSLNVHEEVIQFLMTRIPRSFEAIFKTIDAIDKLSLEQKRNINVNFLSSFMKLN